MRKSLIGVVCCLVVLVWALPAQAQTVGLKAGLVRASLDGDTGEAGTGFKRRSDWAAGAFARFKLGPAALQSEVLYVRRGADVSGAGDGNSLRMDFVEVPVLLRLGSNDSSLYAGGYGAFKVSAKAMTAGMETDLSSDIEDFDYGLVFGISLGFGEFELDGRYSHGLQDLLKDPGAPQIKNRALMLLLGYTF